MIRPDYSSTYLKNLSISGSGSIFDTSGDLDLEGNLAVESGASVAFKQLSLASARILSVSGAGSNLSGNRLSGSGDVAVSEGASVSFTFESSLRSLTVSGAGSNFSGDHLSGSGNVTVSEGASASFTSESSLENLTVSGTGSRYSGSISGAKLVSITDGGSFSGDLNLQTDGQLNVSGAGSAVHTGNVSGNISISSGASVTHMGGGSPLGGLSVMGDSSSYWSAGEANIQGSFSLGNGASMSVQQLTVSGAGSIENAVLTADQIQNSGALEIRGSSVSSTNNGNGNFNNSGSLTGGFSSSYNLQNDGYVSVGAGDSMAFRTGGNHSGAHIGINGSMEYLQTFSNDGTIALSGTLRANTSIENRGAIEVTGTASIWGGDFHNDGSGSVAVFDQSKVNFMDDVTNDGVIAIDTGSTAVFNGSYSGSGSILGLGTTILLGDLRPGHSPGSQSFEGDVVFGDNFAYDVEIAGYGQGTEYDVAHIDGNLTLDGTLSVSPLYGFEMQLGDSFEVLTFGSVTGEFAAYEGLYLGEDLFLDAVWGDHNLVLTVVPEPDSTALLILGALGCGAAIRKRKKGILP